MDTATKLSLLRYFSEFVAPRKNDLFDTISNARTRYLTIALEDIYQSQNASAVLRTCDCFGIQDVHIIENDNEYQVNPDVVVGATKWLTLHKYNEQKKNTLTTITSLKEKGYRIVATTPHTNDVSLENFDLYKGKAAFFFGTELRGLSQEVLDNADEFLKIPMVGFTESFNISVSAAIILHRLTSKLHDSYIDWRLPEDELLELKLNWYRAQIKSSDLIEKEFFLKREEIEKELQEKDQNKELSK